MKILSDFISQCKRNKTEKETRKKVVEEKEERGKLEGIVSAKDLRFYAPHKWCVSFLVLFPFFAILLWFPSRLRARNFRSTKTSD